MHPYRPQIGEGTKLAAQAQETGLRPQSRIRRRPLGSPDRSEQHRIGLETTSQRRGRQRIAFALDGGAAEGKGTQLDLVAVEMSDGREASGAFRNHLGADAVAAEHRDARPHARRSKASISRRASEQKAELIDPLEQAMTRESLERKARGSCHRAASSVQRATSIVTVAPGWAMSQAAVVSSTITGSRPFFRALLRKMSAISVLITARKP